MEAKEYSPCGHLPDSCIEKTQDTSTRNPWWIVELNNDDSKNNSEKQFFECTPDFLEKFREFQSRITIDDAQFSKFKNSIIELLNDAWLDNNSQEANFLKNISKEEIAIVIGVLIVSALIIYFWGEIVATVWTIWRWLSQVWINLIIVALQYERTSSFLLAFIPWSGKAWLASLASNQSFFQAGYLSKEFIQMFWASFVPLLTSIKNSLFGNMNPANS